VDEWIKGASSFSAEAYRKGALTVVYSPLLKSVAADLESKLAESSLAHCQSVDLRSYAHGRHLWLSERPGDCAILALTEPMTSELWEAMKEKFPTEIPTLEMRLSGATPVDLVTGLIAEMRLVASLAKCASKDVGTPNVPSFGRELYYLQLEEVIPKVAEYQTDSVQSKLDVLGARWPSRVKQRLLSRADHDYRREMDSRSFRAVVFDYDGTLSNSRREQTSPPVEVMARIRNLLETGVIVGVASGRGGSVQEIFSSCLSEPELSRVTLGLYNGGWLAPASESPDPPQETSEFLSHVTRLVVQLREMGVPVQSFRTTHPYQVSIRFREGLRTEDMWFVVGDALRTAGLEPTTIVRSKHSVDVLEPGITKARIVSHIVSQHGVRPYEVLAIGDQGAWPGNDAALLEHRYSVSVDYPSRRMDRGWKFAPPHKCQVDATLWYLDRIQLYGHGIFSTLFSDN